VHRLVRPAPLPALPVSSPINRRRFLGHSFAALGGFLLAGASPLRAQTSAPGRGATATPPGTDRVSALAFGASLGLTAKWVEPRQILALESRWTRLVLQADSRESRLDSLRLFLGDPTVLHRGTLWLARIDRERFLAPILAPHTLPGAVPAARTIVLDAGHGGRDTGTRHAGLGYDEKTFTLDLARRLQPLLEAAGHRVVQTRTEDVFVPLPERPALAARSGADLFVSLHFNAVGSTAVHGTETYLLTPQHQRSTGADRLTPADATAYPGNEYDGWNAILGHRLHRRLIADLGSFDRGLKRARFAVLRDLTCPGVLLEAGYLSHDDEARRIATPGWRAQLARSIAGGIAAYAEALDGVRRHPSRAPR
jgi:N-acetylmuramoyl-L-alanine amidase